LKNKIILLLLIFSSFLFSEEAEIAVAILDLDGIGIEKTEAQILTNKLRSEMVKTGKFIILDRSEMGAILEEQGFQQTGCTSSECAVEVGQMLGVQFMVSGSIGKLGDMFYLELKMIDVGTSKIAKSVDKNIDGKLTDVLITGIPYVAAQLAGVGISEQQISTYSSSPKTGFVQKDDEKFDVTITPVNENGKIYLDDALLSTGVYKGRLESDSYDVEEKFEGKLAAEVEIYVTENGENKFQLSPYVKTKIAIGASFISNIYSDDNTSSTLSAPALGFSLGRLKKGGMYNGLSIQFKGSIETIFDTLTEYISFYDDINYEYSYLYFPKEEITSDTIETASFGVFYNQYKEWTLVNIVKLGVGAKIGYRASKVEYIDFSDGVGNYVWSRDIFHHWGGPLLRVGVGYKYVYAVFQTTFMMGMLWQDYEEYTSTGDVIESIEMETSFNMSPEFRFMLHATF
jgi:hypothetical protein